MAPVGYSVGMGTGEPHRKRLRRYEALNHARFLTFSTYTRLPLFQIDTIRGLFAGHLARARDRDGFRLLAWVVMPEHIHLIIWQGESPITRSLLALKSGFAREVLGRWRELDAPVLARLTDAQGRQRFWQRGGGYDRNIRDEDELREKITYIHNNPVKRGLVGRPTDWAWSSARWYDGDRDGPVPIDPWS